MKTSMILIALLLLGCQDKKDSKADTVQPAVAWNYEMLKPGSKLEDLDGANLRLSLIGDSESYMANSPEGNESGPVEEDTDDECSTLIATQPLVATDTTLSLNIALDTSACIAKSLSTGGMVVKKLNSSFKMAIQLSCSAGGLAKLNGKSVKELEDSSVLCPEGDGTGGIMQYIETAMEYNFTSEDGKVTSEMRSISYEGDGMADGSPCTVERKGVNQIHKDGCLSISRTVTDFMRINGQDIQAPETESYSRTEDLGLTSTTTSPWYLTGKKKLQEGAWTGAVTYSGANVAASFQLVNNGETISGTLVTASSLQSMALRAQAAAIPRLKLPKFSHPVQ